jgi:hypothetical protein
MTTACAKWKDQLLESALGGTVGGEFAAHVKTCPGCAAALGALRARRERMDTLLPLVARASEPPGEFHAKVMAAAEASRETPVWFLQRRVLAGAALVLAAIVFAAVLRWRSGPTFPNADLAAAQSLAQWRAPSDVFLETPGREILRTTPRLGESYVNVPIQTNEEE